MKRKKNPPLTTDDERYKVCGPYEDMESGHDTISEMSRCEKDHRILNAQLKWMGITDGGDEVKDD